MRVTVAQGDIAAYGGDAVVNAANNHLVLGGGVAGAIRRAGGPAIQQECDAYVRAHGAIRVGEAVATGGGALPVSWVIHAAAMGDEPATRRSIHGATANALREAERLGVRRLAMPILGSGIAGFPFDGAAELMLAAIAEHAAELPEEVVLYGYSAADADSLRRLVAESRS